MVCYSAIEQNFVLIILFAPHIHSLPFLPWTVSQGFFAFWFVIGFGQWQAREGHQKVGGKRG